MAGRAGGENTNGVPPGGPLFDMSALQNVINEPGIRRMAEELAQDPNFTALQMSLQNSMGGLAEAGRSAGGPPIADPAQYQEVMSQVWQNPQFMEMATKLGEHIMMDPSMAAMMQQLQSPDLRESITRQMESLQEDPQFSDIMKEMESAGPSALMKYWNDPDVLSRMSDVFKVPGDGPSQEEIDLGEDAEEVVDGAADDKIENLHDAASAGDFDMVKEFLQRGDDVNKTDEEGRVALHFACGYGEIEVMDALLEAGADVDAADENGNTPLHYAAGYGQLECVTKLLAKGAKSAAKNKDGKSPVEVAKLNNQDDIVKKLESEIFL